MGTEKSQPESKQIMLEKRFTEFLALSIDPRIGISWSASETDVWLINTYDIKNYYLLFVISFIFDILCRINDLLQTSFHVFHSAT